MRNFVLVLMLLSVSACFKLSNQGAKSEVAQSPSSETAEIPVLEGLQYDGSVAFVSTHDDGSSMGSKVIQISGPIVPNVGEVLYSYEGANYPKSLADEIRIADKASYPFPWLLSQCSTLYQQDYPKITLEKDGTDLTGDQLLTNYSEVARCSYEKYFSKPYWIPQLISNVDICGRQLGENWRLISEEDVNQLSSEDLKILNETLSGAAGNFWASFYVSMNVYIRGSDGIIKQADLGNPETGPVISDLPIKGDQWKMHLEGARALRCIKDSKN